MFFSFCIVIGSDIITDSAGPLRIVSRSDWIAQPPEHELTKLEIPATRVIIAHTGLFSNNTLNTFYCKFYHLPLYWRENKFTFESIFSHGELYDSGSLLLLLVNLF